MRGNCRVIALEPLQVILDIKNMCMDMLYSGKEGPDFQHPVREVFELKLPKCLNGLWISELGQDLDRSLFINFQEMFKPNTLKALYDCCAIFFLCAFLVGY